MKIHDNFLKKILTHLIEKNIRPILVGGCVRDFFLGIAVKDYDIEVYGLDTLENLEAILSDFGRVSLVGKSFGILKLSTDGMEYDFSFPRLENKIGTGHRGFEVCIDGRLSFKKAAQRRDFTINAIGYDYKNKIFLDPFAGRKDIERKLLRYIDKTTFIEDPLRVYRAIQLGGRFHFTLDSSTYKLCQNIVLSDEFKTLSKERIFEEYKKLFLKSSKPSEGLKMLVDLKIETLSYETMNYIDQVVDQITNEEEKLFLILFLLEERGKKIIHSQKILKKLQKFHLFIFSPSIPKKIETQCTYTQKLYQLYLLHMGLPKPHYNGKDLLKMGYIPSEKFKSILDTLYKMQLSGKIW